MVGFTPKGSRNSGNLSPRRVLQGGEKETGVGTGTKGKNIGGQRERLEGPECGNETPEVCGGASGKRHRKKKKGKKLAATPGRLASSPRKEGGGQQKNVKKRKNNGGTKKKGRKKGMRPSLPRFHRREVKRGGSLFTISTKDRRRTSKKKQFVE